MMTLVVGTIVGLWSAVGYHVSVFKELSSARR
jgi:hypothetical protein